MAPQAQSPIRFQKSYNDVFRSAAHKHFGTSEFQDKLAKLTPQQQDRHHEEMKRFMSADLLGKLKSVIGDNEDLIHDVAARIVFGHGEDKTPAFFANYKPKDANLTDRFVSFGRGYASTMAGAPKSEAAAAPAPQAPKKLTHFQNIVRAERGSPERFALPGFYSHLERVIEQKLPNRASPKQIAQTLAAAGVKKDELEWTGVGKFLTSATGPLTKEELLATARAKPLAIKEIVKTQDPDQNPEYAEAVDRAYQLSRQLQYHETDPRQIEIRRQLAEANAEVERLKSDNFTKFHEWQLPGGSNYQERLLTLPTDFTRAQEETRKKFKELDSVAEKYGINSPEYKAAYEAHKEAHLRQMGQAGTPFTSQHWSEPNVLAHVRHSDRVGPNGEKLLHIEELQSDWHKAGRDKGYQSERKPLEWESGGPGRIVADAGGSKVSISRSGNYDGYVLRSHDPEGGHASRGLVFASMDEAKKHAEDVLVPKMAGSVPSAPFKRTWHELLLKHILAHAARNNYSGITWTPGQAQADRYDLSKHISKIEYELHNPADEESPYELHAYDHNGKKVISEEEVPPHELENYVGKDLAEKIMSAHGEFTGGPYRNWRTISGLDLKSGGDGMRNFYDGIVPQYLNKIGKKFGAQVGTTTINVDDDSEPFARTEPKTVPHLPITPEMRQAVTKEGQAQFSRGTPIRFAEPYADETVSTRFPTSKKMIEDPLKQKLLIKLSDYQQTPDLLRKHLKRLAGYTNFSTMPRRFTSEQDQHAALEHIIEHMAGNILWLHDKMDPVMRERAKLWYDGGRKIADGMAAKYGITPRAAAASIAALSQQTEWHVNVDLAHRVVKMMTDDKLQDHRFDDAMRAAGEEFVARSGANAKNKAKAEKTRALNQAKLNAVIGKKLSDLKSTDLQAMWIRQYDAAHHDQRYRMITPEGEYKGFARGEADPNSFGSVNWGGLNRIEKVIEILKDQSLDNISRQLGTGHKVRNFYNNIIAPNHPDGHATIDTHAVGAALLRMIGSSNKEAKDAFGGAGGSIINGLNGTYPIVFEAYRRAAGRRQILPREMQSIVWEAVRGLFGEHDKKQKAKVLGVQKHWEDYLHGPPTSRRIEQARKRIYKSAGGITPPSWTDEGSYSAGDGDSGDSLDEGQLHSFRIPGAGSGQIPGGTGSGTSDAVAAVGPGTGRSSRKDLVLADRGQPLRFAGIAKAGHTESDFASALARLRTENHVAYVHVLRKVFDQIGLRPHKIQPVLHDDQQATKPSVASAVLKPIDQNAAMYAGAWHGILTRQSSVLAFHTQEGGPDSVYQLHLQGGGEQIRNGLNQAGILQRVMVPHGSGFRVIISDKGRRQRDAVGQFAMANNSQVGEATGTAYELGGADDASARANYRDTITKIEQGASKPSAAPQQSEQAQQMNRGTPSRLAAEIGRVAPDPGSLSAEQNLGMMQPKLPKESRDVVRSMLEEGRSHREIGQHLGVPEDSIRKFVFNERRQRRMEIPQYRPKEEYRVAHDMWNQGIPASEIAAKFGMNTRRMNGIIERYRAAFGWFKPRRLANGN